jgi:D-glycero-D-manno-heptose 1,7-bisphosphate phosphatase
VKRAVFLDRDGTINQERDYLYRVDEFEFVTGAPEAIRLLNEAGLFVVVVTNQSGVGRGYYTEEDVETLHRHVAAELAALGAHVDAWLYCPHHPLGKGRYAVSCSCRKPLPGMLLEAAARFGIDLTVSVMIGDKRADVEAGLAAGCRPILVRSGYGSEEELYIPAGIEVHADLLSAAQTLVGQHDGV